MDAGTLVMAGAGVVAGSIAAAVVLRKRSAGELRRARDRLSEAREELREHERSSLEERQVQNLILSSMTDGVLLLEPGGSTIYANPALDELMGGRPVGLSALFPLRVRQAAEAAIEGATTSVLVETGPPPRWLRAEATPVGNDGSVLVVIRDVTEARRLDAVRHDFVANASHELKTPAASIRAVAETLRHAAVEDPSAVPRFAAQLEKEAVRLSRIVADLLDLSRLGSGSTLDERVRLDTLVIEEAQRFEERVLEANLELHVTARESIVVIGSARDLSLLVRNLMDNAIRYTGPGGSVDVEVAADDGSAILRVRDTGIGIPQRDLPRVFERFYRVDRARSRDTGGTGLGLAIVKHVTENHGGSVSVASELGRGTTFTVELPRDGG